MEAAENIEAPEDVSHETEESPTIESLAQEMGWSPQEEWRGDPEKWVSADQYIRNTRSIQDHFQKKNKYLKSDLEALESKLDGLIKTQSQSMMQALREQKERLQREFDEAVEAGDKAAAKRATASLKELEQKEVPQNDQAEMIAKWKPHADDFAERNSAALGDKLVQIEASKLITALAEAGVPPEDTYERVEQELRKKYPEHYQNQNRARPPKVGGESRPSVADKSKWGALVKEFPEADGIFQKFVRQGVYKDTKEDRERYAKTALED